MKKKYLVWGAIATIAGVGYYYWNKGKEERQRRKREAKDVLDGTPITQQGTLSNTSNLGSSSTSGAPTQAQIDLAVAYRKWANSTDALKKKWGKTSTYDLDETSPSPYNEYFLNSYNGGGKAEYEAYLKAKESGSGSSTNSVTQSQTNKLQMDLLVSNLTASAYPTITTSGSNRRAKVLFIVPFKIRKYYSSIVFFEDKSGKDKNTFSLYDGYKDKKVGVGYWKFNDNGTYSLIYTSGSFATVPRTAMTGSLKEVLLKSIKFPAASDIEYVRG